MYFQYKSLCKDLQQYKKVIIYGTGNYAQMLYPYLIKFGLQEKIVCFTQTNVDDKDSVYGVPIVPIKELGFNKAECVVLIAVGKLYTGEIRQTLIEYKYSNIISLTDYQRSGEYFECANTFEEYSGFIADWYLETHKNPPEQGGLIQEIIKKGQNIDRKKDSNLIVMICGTITPRTVKIIGALKRKSYDIVMMDYCEQIYDWMSDELQKANVKVYKCQCIEEMLYYALQYNPFIYFFEPRWGDCQWAQIMLQQKQCFGKIVLALYDVLNGAYIGESEDRLATEKYALEHADGIVWRWFSKEFLEKKGFQYQGKSIQFLDYCDHEDKDMDDTIIQNLDSSVIKLCLVNGDGNVYVEERAYPIKYSVWARIEEILAKIGNKSNCIVHFYTGTLTDENIALCKYYEKQYSNFRFFLATGHSELLKKLKNYDYGCELFTDGDEPPDDSPVAYYKGSFYRNSVRNAFFDFIGAGLPVITTYATKMWEYLSAYDIVIKMNVANIDLDFLKQNQEYYKQEVKRARKELDIDNQISRMIQFFKEV